MTEEASAFRALLSNMPESVAIYELDGRVLYVNPATERTFGKTSADLVGRRLFEVFPEAIGNAFHAAFERVVASGQPEVFDHYYAPFDRWFANRISRVGERVHVVARDVTEDVRRRRRLETLARISAVMTGDDVELASRISEIAKIVSDVLDADCNVALLSADGATLEVAAAAFADARLRDDVMRVRRWDATSGHPGEALRRRKAILADRASLAVAAERVTDPELRSVVNRYAPGSLLVVPLFAGDEAVGVLIAVRQRQRPPLGEDARVLAEAIAPSLGLFLAHARRRADAALRLESLLSLAARLAATTLPDDVARVVVDEGVEALDASLAGMFLVSPDGKELVLARERGFLPAHKERFARIALPGSGPMHDALASKRPVWIASRAEYAARYPAFESEHRPEPPPPICFVIMPLEIEGRVVGCLNFTFHDERRLGDVERAYLEVLASHVTEALRRARLYAELRDVSETREAMIRASPAAIVLLDRDGVVRAWNPAAERMYGWPAAEALGRPFPAAGERHEEFSANVRRVLDGEVLSGLEAEHRRAGGELFDVELHAARVPLSDGETVCLVIVADITHRKRIERGRRLVAEASATLAKSLDLGRTLSALVRVPIPGFADWCCVDLLADGALDRIAVSHDDAAPGVPIPRRIEHDPSRGGASLAIATGKPQVIHDLDAAALERLARDAAHLDALQHLGMRSILSVPLITPGGSIGALSLGTRSRNFDDIDLGIVTELAHHVVTTVENARLYAAAEQARNDAERASRVKDEFLAVLGHELRNPLAPIVTAVELMRMREPDRLVRERDVIARQVGHLSRLVDDLLDVSRITRGKVELRREEIALASVIERAIEMTSPLLERRKSQLTVDVPPSLVVHVDATRLAQVVANLLVNAAKYTNIGGRIAVAAHATEDAVVLTVRDDGIGIDPETLPQIFDTFVRAPEARGRGEGGLGLGLAIAKSLVTAHAGQIEARSEGAGRGTEVIVTLPRARITAETSAASIAVDDAAAKRILIVDDNEDAANLLAEFLGAHGHEIATAYDGPSALALVDRFRPDIGVLDIGLPVMDGYELAERLRATRALKLIAVTGYGQESDRERARRAGFDHHLAKPVPLEALLEFVEAPPASRKPS